MTVKTHKNFYNDECLKFIGEGIEISKTTANLRTSYPSKRWQQEIIKDSAPVLIYYMNDHMDTDLLNKNLKDKIPFEGNAHFMIHYWPIGSYIPWHDDMHFKSAATFYCNPYWHRDWGGAFLYEDGDKILAEFPEYNKLILQTGNMWHSTTSVTRSYYSPIDWDNGRVSPVYPPHSDIRTTLQIWMEND